jgi:oxygen-independent coproporphyrinogen-3 oxidase
MPASGDEAATGFGIYIHWPFCLSKCPYCDFNSHVAAAIDHDRWRAALLAELDHFAAGIEGRAVTSVFFGGGTPSLMEPGTVEALLDRIAAIFRLPDSAEITLEANPGAVDAERFAGFRAAGVNRLSLGVQALDDAALKFLGRRHDHAEAMVALDLARRHFPRVSFDLIYARPGQTAAQWEAELTRALGFGTDHLSLYQLTIEEGTPFAGAYRRGEFVLPEDESGAELFALTRALTAAAGRPAYEVSNHAAPGQESRHNLLYWQGGDWLGIGPGAHGRLRREDGLRATRQFRAPNRWLESVAAQGHGTEDAGIVSPADDQIELLMMGLRLEAGVSAARFERLTGTTLEAALDAQGLAAMLSGGMVEWRDGHLRATAAGMPVLNSVLARLVR